MAIVSVDLEFHILCMYDFFLKTMSDTKKSCQRRRGVCALLTQRCRLFYRLKPQTPFILTFFHLGIPCVLPRGAFSNSIFVSFYLLNM